MDPVEKISLDVKMRVNSLGTEIIRFDEEKKRIAGSADLSEAERKERIEAARNILKRHMRAAFGEEDGSISFDIQRVVEASKEKTPEMERVRKAAGIWREELPGLESFLEYCAGMIEAHPGEISPEVRESQKCITEAAVVLEKISRRVEREVRET